MWYPCSFDFGRIPYENLPVCENDQRWCYNIYKLLKILCISKFHQKYLSQNFFLSSFGPSSIGHSYSWIQYQIIQIPSHTFINKTNWEISKLIWVTVYLKKFLGIPWGGPVIRTWHFHCWGHGSIPGPELRFPPPQNAWKIKLEKGLLIQLWKVSPYFPWTLLTINIQLKM